VVGRYYVDVVKSDDLFLKQVSPNYLYYFPRLNRLTSPHQSLFE
jgi:hypothetical protein